MKHRQTLGLVRYSMCEDDMAHRAAQEAVTASQTIENQISQTDQVKEKLLQQKKDQERLGPSYGKSTDGVISVANLTQNNKVSF